MSISKNIEMLRKEIRETATLVGRSFDEITLIAVSKTVGPLQVEEAIDCGIKDFGENRVQELMGKKNEFDNEIKWHQIGRLQTNKIKYLVGKNILIHSVDRLELAEEISRQSENAGVVTDILIQINVSREDTKAGIFPEEINLLLNKISELRGLIVVGLMTIAPNTENLREIRQVFRTLRKIYVDIQNERIDNNIQMKYLSMGMSHDFKIAIEEGSNMLRIGTSIFGDR